ncbi:hypothetical protein STAFG_0839 [Streptomyces afghaniensis 772]|uniref:Glyoxalase-like domain-containing protein n=1 Tax=Streptomyces afghaniensis 772 TaxID=1283301 RepID=S4MYD5_9ACTN|nr:hypothetical protein STAFG_0839 [Streptomyces afghaniensis 772]
MDAVLRRAERGRRGGAGAGTHGHGRGRADLPAAGPGGAAGRPGRGTFGIWEGDLFTDWETWRNAQPAFITLHTRDAFDAAIFYGEVLDWASESPGCCEVHYEGGEVVLRSRGDVVARIESGALEAAPTRRSGRTGRSTSASTTSRPCTRAAELHGGSVLSKGSDEAVLRDHDGAQFTVTARRGR